MFISRRHFRRHVEHSRSERATIWTALKPAQKALAKLADDISGIPMAISRLAGRVTKLEARAKGVEPTGNLAEWQSSIEGKLSNLVVLCSDLEGRVDALLKHTGMESPTPDDGPERTPLTTADEIIGLAEAAAILGISLSAIRQRIKSAKGRGQATPFYKDGEHVTARWVARKADVLAMARR